MSVEVPALRLAVIVAMAACAVVVLLLLTLLMYACCVGHRGPSRQASGPGIQDYELSVIYSRAISRSEENGEESRLETLAPAHLVSTRDVICYQEHTQGRETTPPPAYEDIVSIALSEAHGPGISEYSIGTSENSENSSSSAEIHEYTTGSHESHVDSAGAPVNCNTSTEPLERRDHSAATGSPESREDSSRPPQTDEFSIEPPESPECSARALESSEYSAGSLESPECGL